MKRDKGKNSMNQTKTSQLIIYDLGKQLGLDMEEIPSIFHDNQQIGESRICSLGPPQYGSGFYGSISIFDFEIL